MFSSLLPCSSQCSSRPKCCGCLHHQVAGRATTRVLSSCSAHSFHRSPTHSSVYGNFWRRWDGANHEAKPPSEQWKHSVLTGNEYNSTCASATGCHVHFQISSVSLHYSVSLHDTTSNNLLTKTHVHHFNLFQSPPGFHSKETGVEFACSACVIPLADQNSISGKNTHCTMFVWNKLILLLLCHSWFKLYWF